MFLLVTLTDGYLTVMREVPQDGSKDWNDQLIRQEIEKAQQEAKEEIRTSHAGIDLNPQSSHNRQGSACR